MEKASTLWRFGLTGLVLFVSFAAPFVIQKGSAEPLFGAETPQLQCLVGDKLQPCTMDEFKRASANYTDDQVRRVKDLQSKGSDGIIPANDGTMVEPFRLWTLEPHSGSPFEALSSGGFAIAVIAGLVAVGKLARSRWFLAPLVGVGSMSLTAYVAHVIAIALTPVSGTNALAIGLCVGLYRLAPDLHRGPLGPVQRRGRRSPGRLPARID